MPQDVITLGRQKKSRFIDKVMEILPEGGNLNLCLTCGACASGCPATGLDGYGPQKISTDGRPRYGRRDFKIGLALDVHHVPALHLCVSHEN